MPRRLHQTRQRGRVSTNDYVRKVLISATRENWEDGKRITKKKQQDAERLSLLYGYRTKRSKSISGKKRVKASQAGSGNVHLKETGKSKAAFKMSSPGLHPDVNLALSDTEQEAMLPDPSVGFLDSLDNLSQATEMTNMLEAGASTHWKSTGSLPSIVARPTAKRACRTGVNPGNTKAPGEDNGKKPWYAGYRNSPTPIAYSAKSDAKRYGFVGAQRMERKAHEFERTVNYQTHSTPHFLGPPAALDEYVDNLDGPPGNWPAFSMYVCGSRLKEYPERPDLTEGFSKWLDKSKASLEDFNRSVYEERQDFRNRSVGTLIETDSLGYPKHRNNKLLQDARRMKYTKGMTVYYSNSNSRQARKENIRRIQEQQRLRTAVRWREQLYLFKAMRSNSNRRPGLEEFNSLYHELKRSTVGDCFTLDRKSFVLALLGRYDDISARNLNQLYSCYDPERLDIVDYRFVLIDQRCLWMLEAETVATKISALFALISPREHDNVVSPTLSEDLVHYVLATVCMDTQEKKVMKEAVNQVLGAEFQIDSSESPKGRISRPELVSCVMQDDRQDRVLIEAFIKGILARLPEELRNAVELA